MYHVTEGIKFLKYFNIKLFLKIDVKGKQAQVQA